MSHSSHSQQDHEEEMDDEHIPPAEEDDIIYLDDDEIEAMDQDDDEDGGDDFQTINESELGEGNYQEGQILAHELIPDHSVVKFAGVHKDSVFSVNVVPKAPFNTFVSGDCDDKCYVWKIVQNTEETPVVEGTIPSEEKKEEQKQEGAGA